MATCISPQQGLDAFNDSKALFVDVRDPASHTEAHIRGAVSLTQQSLEQFLADTDHQQPLVIYCYHGHSSVSASDFLSEQGFTDVVSLDGGFEHWRQAYPDTLATA